MLDAETLRLMGKRAKLEAAKTEDLPLMINEDWGSELLNQAYKDRLTGVYKDNIKEKEDSDG